MLLFIFHDFILGKLYYLFFDIAMDSILLNFPHIFYVTRYLHTEGFPLWSFAQGMGQNIMAPSLANPFYWIVYLAGTSNAAYSIICMEIAKVLLTAVAFYHFLKLWNLTDVSTIIGTLLYCFSGFMFVGGQWWIFSTEACYLAILLLSFEKLYRQNSWYLFPLAVALLAVLNPFMLYTSSLFLFIYFLFRHFSSEEPWDKKFISLFLKMCCLGLLGLMISSLFLVANIQHMIDSPRGSGNFSYFHTLSSIPIFALENPEHYVTALLRFFSNDLMGNGVTYSGWHNYLEAPLFYIGLLPLLLLPQIFILFKKRKLIVYASLLLFFIIPVIFPYFRYAFSLFAGDYYRSFSFFVSLSLLILGLYALNEIERKNTINLYILLGTFLVFIIIVFFPYQTNITNINIADRAIYLYPPTGIISINLRLRFVISIFLIIYTTLIFLFRYDRYKSLLRVLLLIVIMIEIGYMNSDSLNNRNVLLDWDMINYFNGNTKDSVDYINATDKEFYRINISPELTPDIRFLLNNAKIQGYYGTPSYDSFNQKYYIRFLKGLGTLGGGYDGGTRLCYGLMNRPLLWSFASIKYYIGKNSDMTVMQLGFKPIKEIAAATVYQNSNFLPLGYTYHQYIPLSIFGSLSVNQKELVLQKAIVVEEPIDPEIKSKLKEFDLNNLSKNYTADSYSHDIAILNQNTFDITHFSQNHIDGTIRLDTPKILFFTIPYDKGWSAVMDNKKIKPYLSNIGFTGFLLEPGYHNIKLSYVPPYFSVSLIVSVLGLLLYLGLIAVQFSIKRHRKH